MIPDMAENHYERLENFLRQNQVVSMLEVFGGWGYMTERAVSAGVGSTLIELDPQRVHDLRNRFRGVEVIAGNVFDVLPGMVGQGRKFDFVDVDNNSRSLRPTRIPWKRSSFEHFDLCRPAFQLARRFVRFCIIQEAAGPAFLRHCGKTGVDKAISQMVAARQKFYGSDRPQPAQMLAAYQRMAAKAGHKLDIADWHAYNDSHGRLTLAIVNGPADR